MLNLEHLSRLTQNMSILIVEDETPLRESIHGFLEKLFAKVYSASDGQEGIKRFLEYHPDLIITDIMMPRMNGITMMEKIKEAASDQPFMVVSAFTETSYFLDAIRLGASGYIIKPIDFDQFLGTLFTVCSSINDSRQELYYRSELESKVAEQTEKIVINYEKTILSLVGLVEQRDTYTAGHSQRVAHYSQAIANALGYDDESCRILYQAGILHDIGKIGTPDAILLKPDRLNDIERNLAQDHVTNGYSILSTIPMYQNLASIVGAHHERWNGSGYPYALAGEEIPVLSRIMMIADTFDAMTSSRIYKPAKTVFNAIAEIKTLSGIDFDPSIVEIACEVLEKVYVPDEFTQHPRDILSIERLAYYFKDQITGVYGFDYLAYLAKHDPDRRRYTCACIFHLQGVEQINAQKGRSGGDKVLKKFAEMLSVMFPGTLTFRPYGICFVQLCPEGTCPINKEEQINDIPFLRENNLKIKYETFLLSGDDSLTRLYDALLVSYMCSIG